MIWYLQNSSSEDRLIIDSKENSGCITEETVTASCWIEAKKKFGFELTPIQEVLLKA